MIAKRSAFELKEFFLLDLGLKFSHLQDGTEIPDLLDSYNIDIDYAIRGSEGYKYQLFVKVFVNFDERLPGFSINAEGVGFFEFDPGLNIPQSEKSAFLNFSGVSICLNTLRGIISNVTSNSALGRYLLPSIDVNSLIEQKANLLKGIKDNESRAKRIKLETIEPAKISRKKKGNN